MADDIPGHEHLDHGKHLHKPGFHPKPSYWMGIWVRHPKDAHHDHGHEHHGEHGKEHATHAKHDHDHGHHESKSHAKAHVPEKKVVEKKKERKAPVRNILVLRGTTMHEIFTNLHWSQMVIALAVIVPLGLYIFGTWEGLVLAAIISALNVIVEFHKWFTEGSPLDFEILTFGAAYLAATGYLFWALVLAVVGPFVADKSRGPVDEDTGFRMFGVFVSAFAGFALGAGTWAVFIATVAGVFAQFVIASLIADNGPVFNIVESGSTVALAAYLSLFVLPLVL